MSRFVVTRAPGPEWDPQREIREQAGWEAHAAVMDAWAAEGFVAFGGPAGDGAVLAVDAPDEAAVRARLADDPWTPGLLRTAAIEPWTIWLGDDARVQGARTGPLHLVTHRPGPRWEPGTPRREQAGWDAHAAFMDGLTERGTIVIGGPLDEERALLVVRGEEPAVRDVLAADPWHEGVLAIEALTRWTLWL